MVFGNDDIEISVFNLLGEKISLDVDRRQMSVDCRSLKPGIYFVEVAAANKYFRAKFVKE